MLFGSAAVRSSSCSQSAGAPASHAAAAGGCDLEEWPTAQRLNGSTARYKWVRILVISDGYSRVITWDIGFFQVLDGSFHLLGIF